MNKLLRLEIITPEMHFLNMECFMVVLPTVEGDIGVLKSHTKYIAPLVPGVIKIYSNYTHVDKNLFIGGGFVEVDEDKTVVMSENVFEINQDSVALFLKNTQSLQEELAEESVLYKKNKAVIESLLAIGKV